MVTNKLNFDFCVIHLFSLIYSVLCRSLSVSYQRGSYVIIQSLKYSFNKSYPMLLFFMTYWNFRSLPFAPFPVPHFTLVTSCYFRPKADCSLHIRDYSYQWEHWNHSVLFCHYHHQHGISAPGRIIVKLMAARIHN